MQTWQFQARPAEAPQVSSIICDQLQNPKAQGYPGGCTLVLES